MLLDGVAARRSRTRHVGGLKRRVQMVFQDPFSSLNPRMTVGAAMGEAAGAGRRMSRAVRAKEVEDLLELVHLDPAVVRELPGRLSGGQRQRVAGARALAVRPEVLIADEITSALDVSVQSAILNLLRDVRDRLGISILFVSHNLATVRYVSDMMAVMYLGRLVESRAGCRVGRRASASVHEVAARRGAAARRVDPRRRAVDSRRGGAARPAPSAERLPPPSTLSRRPDGRPDATDLGVEVDPREGAQTARLHPGGLSLRTHGAGLQRLGAFRADREGGTMTAATTTEISVLGARLEELREKHGVPAASVAVLRGEEVDAAASGILNLDTGVEATDDSLFQIGSITKVWTATLAMQLVDEGRIELDAPVRRYLPDFRVADDEVSEAVTVRHLLRRTPSGIDGDHFADTGRGDDYLERYVETCAELPQVHPLGATMSYCNTGFTILGRMLEVVTDLGLGLTCCGSASSSRSGSTHTVTLPEDEVLALQAAIGHIQPVGTRSCGRRRCGGFPAPRDAGRSDLLDGDRRFSASPGCTCGTGFRP